MDIDKNIWNEFSTFQKICRNNPVFPDCEFLSHFLNTLPQLELTINPGTSFFRARIYQSSFPDFFAEYVRKNPEESLENKLLTLVLSMQHNHSSTQHEAGFNGYNSKDSFVNPNPKTISEGRCNHNHEQCLYLAEDIDTAISELKPLIREKISVARIESIEELRLVDLGFSTANDPYQKLIAFLFVTSPTQDEYDIYTFTQVISSLIKQKGYDGIRYSSCQNLSKLNYAIFNYNKCKPVSSDVFEVESISYRSKKT